MHESADMLRRAKKAGLDLLDAEVLVHYLKRAVGDMDKAIVLAEAESPGAYGERQRKDTDQERVSRIAVALAGDCQRHGQSDR